ncbi:hypothetical protein FQN54_009588 [Arachnomyces sp. PD_36]|nr:hypothetical protein FQN54_009588 [Arachnomyces sp. PD_36]
MPTNRAAYLTGQGAPLEIKSAPYPTPRDDQILVKNHAIPINPVDWYLQENGVDLFEWITLPFVAGEDIAGEVVEVGSAVTRFKVGDRVAAMVLSVQTNDPTEGGFQEYSLALEKAAVKIPDSLSYEQASVFPMCLATAAAGLFEEDQLALPYATFPPRNPTGEYVLITGGASSVGCNAIQLAVAAGYQVITTSSAKNFDFVKRLGASHAFDYNDPNHSTQIKDLLKGKTLAGALSISRGTFPTCTDVVQHSEGRKFVSNAVPFDDPVPDGIRTGTIFACTIVDNGIADAIYRDFIPQALADGSFIVAPEPQVAGAGLESLEAAMALQKKGVSASKVVVTL